MPPYPPTVAPLVGPDGRISREWLAFFRALGSGGGGDLPVSLDTNGALEGDGTPATPLAVRVDGATITINGENQLAALGIGDGIAQNTFLVSGGQVVWIEDYEFLVSAATYYIQGTLYTSPQTTVTLDAADLTLDRIDAIVVTTAGTATKVTGTAAAQPSEPDIDPADELKLAIVLVTAATTAPASADTVLLFAEAAGSPTEWDWTTSGSGFNVNSTNSPRTGTKSIEGTNIAAGAYAQGAIGSGTLDPNGYTYLVLYLKSKAQWSNNRGLTVSLRNGGTLVGSAVNINRSGTFGFNSANVTDYQQVAIPIANFAIGAGLTIDQIRIAGFGGAIGCYLDDLSFQGQVVTQPPAGLTQEQADARYAPLGPSFVTLAADATLPHERVLTAGAGISVIDGGAGGAVTIAATGGSTPASTVEDLDGTGDAGTSTEFSRGDHKHADPNRPTDDEKDALAGTDGTPSAANPFVTDSDPRLTGGGGSGIDELTGDVTAGPGSGAQAATIAADAVTYAKLQNVSAASRVLGRGSAAGSGDPEELTPASGVEIDGTDLRLTQAMRTRVITFGIDGGGSVITTGLKFGGRVPWTGTITKVILLSDPAGDIVIDIWKDSYANYPPTVADTITASAKPTLSAADKYEDATLTGWNTALTAGDVLYFHVDSVATVHKIALQLEVLT